MSRVPLERVINAIPGGAASLMDALFKSEKQGLETQFYPQTQQAAIDYQKALTGRIPYENRLTEANAIAQENKNPYEADFILSQIMGNKANASRAPFENMLNKAQANTMNAGLPYIGREKEADIAKTLLANQLTQERIPVERNLLQSQIDRNNFMAQGGMGGVRSQDDASYMQAVSKANPDFTPEEKYEAQDRVRGGYDTLENGKKIKVTPTMTSKLSQIMLSTLTPQQKLAVDAHNKVEYFLKQGDKAINGAARFSALAGKYRMGVEQFAQQFTDKTNPDYLDYLQFRDQIVPQMSVPLVLIEGGHPTNVQKNIMSSVLNPISNGNNEATVKELWKRQADTIRKGISPVSLQNLAQSNIQAMSGKEPTMPAQETQNNGNANATTPKPKITEDVIQEYVNRKGISRDAVIKSFKEKGYM